MQRKELFGTMAGLLLAVGLLGTAHAQFGAYFNGNKKDKPIDVSSYPANIQREYRVFKNKCSECHTTAKALQRVQTPDLAKLWVLKMQAMPAADITDKQATEIIDFINYNQSRAPKTDAEAPAKSAAEKPDAPSIAAGKNYYNSQDCAGCHTTGRASTGQNMNSLANVGSTMTREQILSVLQGSEAANGMPALPSGSTPKELNNLVSYLQSLNAQ